jgi:hypothetical protein
MTSATDFQPLAGAGRAKVAIFDHPRENEGRNDGFGVVKFCGEDGDGNQSTPFSNIISFGPVPAA